ncbi:MAG: cell surface protein [Parcubacteria group bacterium Athens1014_10]|nr:MAG: cell surface protein [Parcubacteria group bacterium Athens1014_10]
MNKKLVFLISIVFALFILVLPRGFAAAATYYVSPSGNNTTGNGTRVNPWQTPYYGCTHMSGGDTLILMDGTYSYISGGARTWSNQIRPPSGPDANHYTIVKAENDWQAIINFAGEGADMTGGDAAIAIWGGWGGTARYIQVEGIKVINTTGALTTSDCQYIKIKRIAHISSPGNGADNSGYGEPYLIMRGSDHVLLEDSWTSGCIRYGVLVVGDNDDPYADTTNIIIRRVVVRMDYKAPGQPKACFAAYGGNDTGLSSVDNILFQNDICIDWNPASPGMTEVYGGFYNPKFTKSVKYQGCIALNLKPAGGMHAAFYTLDNYYQNIGPSILENCVAWDCDGRAIYWNRGGAVGIRSVTATANQCTFGNLRIASPYAYVNDGYSPTSAGWIISTLSNSIIDSANATNITYFDSEKYNSYNIISPPSGATNAITTDNRLLYITRVENGSTCKGTGEGGVDRGATIQYRYGVDGTLWGETGYNTLTSTNLWPYPYEDNIRLDFRMTNNPTGTALPTTNNATRGFCADGQTLTKYIWEYLGNPCPFDICNYGSTPEPEPEPVIPPSITLAKQVDKSQASAGALLTYTLTFQNTSVAEAKNIVITDEIPEGTTYVANSATNGGIYNSGANELTWTIPSIVAGASGQVSFQARIE